MKIFDLFETDVKLEDPGLRRYINLTAKIPSKGREREKFGKTKVNIVERLINALSVPGHRGKKHKIMTAWATGKWTAKANIVIKTFKLIEQKTGQKALQVFVKAIENCAPCDEITTIEYGGARYPQAVDTSPFRRLHVALHNIVHSAYDKAFGKKKSIAEALADEIIAASQASNESHAFLKRIESEKMADSAR